VAWWPHLPDIQLVDTTASHQQRAGRPACDFLSSPPPPCDGHAV